VQEEDTDGIHHVPVPALLGLFTRHFVPFCKQGRVFPVQVQYGGITEKKEPQAEEHSFRPQEVPRKEEDECREDQDIQECEYDLLVHS